ncbi:hypothetical protein ABKV19_009608 [Rosa sericea]
MVVDSQHDQIISGIDWNARSNKIVTSSHDRNFYVWNLEGSEWVPTFVILRPNRAALCVKWSPKENKFAVGSGGKTVCICYYEQENNWWVSKLIRKRHDSSVTSVAWHPNNHLQKENAEYFPLILRSSMQSTLRIGVELHSSESRIGSSPDAKFGELVLQLDLPSSWAFGVKWSPSGNTLAYVGHNSMIYFVDEVGPSPLAQNVAYRDLPLHDVLFLSERLVIGVGFDCNPMVFAADEREIWSFIRFLEERKITSAGPKYGSQLSGAFRTLYGQPRHGLSNGTNEQSRPQGRVHKNCINCIVPLGSLGSAKVMHFRLDGKVVVWDLENQADLSEYL